MNLLVVDDDDDLRDTLAEVLAEHGHAVEVAPDGAAALRRLEATATIPDAILLDWMMPRMDGLEFRRRQRADPRLARIPVVLMTAATEARVPLADLAPDASVRKPVELATLLDVIGRVAPVTAGERLARGEPTA